MYEINGQALLLCPEKTRWLDHQSIGLDGSNRNTYGPRSSFEIAWGPMSSEQFSQICNFAEAVSVSGTVDIVLPSRCAELWTGIHYDAKLDKPTSAGYWNTYHMDVKMLVRDIQE